MRVSIDDFGTGYTSLAAIPYLPLDEIKVDMQFVKRAPTSAADEAIVRCVHELAHRLGLVTVAEGVEDEVVRDLMVEIEFDLLQGYHFSKGLPETELLSFIAKSNCVVGAPNKGALSTGPRQRGRRHCRRARPSTARRTKASSPRPGRRRNATVDALRRRPVRQALRRGT